MLLALRKGARWTSKCLFNDLGDRLGADAFTGAILRLQPLMERLGAFARIT